MNKLHLRFSSRNFVKRETTRIQEEITIIWLNFNVVIKYKISEEKKISEIRKDLSNILGFNNFCIEFGNFQCQDSFLVREYQHSKYKFCIILTAIYPKDFVRNFRIIQKLKGNYSENSECVICLYNKSNIATLCGHDCILCSECIDKIKDCPYCRTPIRHIQFI